MSEFSTGYPLRKSYLNRLCACRLCDKFGEKSSMIKIEPPGEDGYFICLDCYNRATWLFPRQWAKHKDNRYPQA